MASVTAAGPHLARALQPCCKVRTKLGVAHGVDSDGGVSEGARVAVDVCVCAAV